MSTSLLPHGLMDLTLARASARLEGVAFPATRRSLSVLARRFAHQSVSLENLTTAEYVPYESEGDRSLYSRRQGSKSRNSALASPGLFQPSIGRPLTELEKRIADLKETPVPEVPQDRPPSYSEHELISMYEDLLAIPSQIQNQELPVTDPQVQRETDQASLQGTIQALFALEDPSAIATDIRSQYSAAISKLTEIVEALESVPGSSTTILSEVSLLSEEQWISLVRLCVQESDGQAAETVLDLIQRTKCPIPAPAMEATVSLYAEAGDVSNVERFLTHFAPSPSERLRDLHVKAHIRAVEPRTFPTTALATLHGYEARGLAAPQRSYTRCITALLSCRSTVAEAQAWDLFSHMRYVSHPNPDPYLYTVMIFACASRVLPPQPARALDLFTEMTVDKGIPPTVASYTAAIYACARSGEKLYVGEAFRLAKEMLDGHRDAYGNSAFTPDRKTFCALLEGAKRIGDLAKVRWILAEIVAEHLRATRGDVGNAVVVDEGIMTHVFHSYAAYKPPFVRSDAKLVDEIPLPPASTTGASESEGASPNAQDTIDAATMASAEARPPVALPTHRFTTLVPQSHSEVIGETCALFSRIIHDGVPHAYNTTFHKHQDMDESTPHAFQHVELTPRLLNAFLSVHYAHCPIDESTHVYHTLFSELKVEKNAYSYVEALEYAARANRRDRKPALKFSREVWQEWSPLEEAWWRRENNAVGLNARLVERGYVAMIRMLSLTGHLREAVQLVRTFVERYPPNVIRNANPKLALRSTRTLLLADRPLVRMLSPVEVPDDTVPPMLSFQELEVLHHKLVAAGDRDNIGYIKYVCMSYSGALKRRKEATLHAKPGTESTDDTEVRAEDA